MFHSSYPLLRKSLLLGVLIVTASVWLVAAVPAFAQQETPEPSMVQEFFENPDLVAPLVVPMILALGGLLTLMAFLGWIFTRMPNDGEAEA